MTSAPEIVYSPTAQRQLAHIRRDERFTQTARLEKIAEILAACGDCAEFPRRWPAGKVEGTRERRVIPTAVDDDSSSQAVGIARGVGGAAARQI